MFPTFIGILDIQSWWEVPSIAHFCSLFRDTFNLLDFDIEDLEEALLTDGSTDGHLLQELIVRLLEGCLPDDTRNDISTFNYQMFLRRLFRKKCQEYNCENPFNTDVDFELLPLRQKVEILRALCDFRLDTKDVEESLLNLDSDCLRVEPLGHDRKNSTYWYFYGTRLYREDYIKSSNSVSQNQKNRPRDKKHKKRRNRLAEEKEKEKAKEKNSITYRNKDKNKESIWQVVCFTLQDWSRLVEKFKDSEYATERQLYRTLSEDFMPEIPKLFDLKEKQQRRRILQRSYIRNNKSNSNENINELNMVKNKIKTIKITKKTVNLPSKNAKIEKVVPLPIQKKKGRQTNNSLASAVDQIIIDTHDNIIDIERKEGFQKHGNNICSGYSYRYNFGIEEEEQQIGMHKVLKILKDHEDAWPFIEPVNEQYAPRYYSVVRRPMDISTMEDKLESGAYKTINQFKRDFILIIENCKQYNGSDNEYTEMAMNLKEVFDRAVDRYLESEQSSDDSLSVNSDTGINCSNCKKNSAQSFHYSKRPNNLRKLNKKAKLNAKISKKQMKHQTNCDSNKQENEVERKMLKIKEKKGRKKIKKCKNEVQLKEIEMKQNKSAINNTNSIKSRRKQSNNEYTVSKLEKILIKEDIKNEPIKNNTKIKKEIQLDIESCFIKELRGNSKRKYDIEKNYDFVSLTSNKSRKIEKKENTTSDNFIVRAKNSKIKKLESQMKSIDGNEKLSFLSRKSKKNAKIYNKKFESLDKQCDAEKKNCKKKGADLLSNGEVENKSCIKNIKSKKNMTKAVVKKIKSLFTNKDIESLDSLKDKISEKRKKEKLKIEQKKLKKQFFKNESLHETSKKVPFNDTTYNYKVDKVGSKMLKPRNAIKKGKNADNNNKNVDDFEPKKIKTYKHTKGSRRKDPTIQALNQATEQTLNDINKWLDDAPRVSEFSIKSDSPILHMSDFSRPISSKQSTVASTLTTTVVVTGLATMTTDVSSRKRLNSIKLFGSCSSIRPKKIQRNIDRLQPGKSKGNLLTKKPMMNENNSVGDTTIDKLITDNDQVNRAPNDEPKLSLGSVLKNVDSIQLICKSLVSSPNPNGHNDDDDDEERFSKSTPFFINTTEHHLLDMEKMTVTTLKDAKMEKGIEIEEIQKPKSATPNLSAWFKAFGVPKSKKKEEEEETASFSTSIKKEEILENSSASYDHQRRMSTGGSSISESVSSYSQESSPNRRGLSPQQNQNPLSALHTPTNIEPQLRGAGFYQDALSSGTSPYNSPYYTTPPRYSAQLPPTPSPQNHLHSPVYPSPGNFDQSSLQLPVPSNLYSQLSSQTSQQSFKPSSQAHSPNFSQQSPPNCFSQNSSEGELQQRYTAPLITATQNQSLIYSKPQQEPYVSVSSPQTRINYSQLSPRSQQHSSSSRSSPQQSNFTQTTSTSVSSTNSQPSSQSSGFITQIPNPFSQSDLVQPPLQNRGFSQKSPQQITNYSQSLSQTSTSYLAHLSPQQQPSLYSQTSSQTSPNYSQTLPQQPRSYSHSHQTSRESPVNDVQQQPQIINFSQSSNQQNRESQLQTVQAVFTNNSETYSQNVSATSFTQSVKSAFLESSSITSLPLVKSTVSKDKQLQQQQENSVQNLTSNHQMYQSAAGTQYPVVFPSNVFPTVDRVNSQLVTESSNRTIMSKLTNHETQQIVHQRQVQQNQEQQTQLLSLQQNLSAHESLYSSGFQGTPYSMSNVTCHSLYSGYFDTNAKGATTGSLSSGNNLVTVKKRMYNETSTTTDIPSQRCSNQEQFGFDSLMSLAHSQSDVSVTMPNQFDSTFSNSHTDSVTSNPIYTRLHLGLVARGSKDTQLLLSTPRSADKKDSSVLTHGKTTKSSQSELNLNLIQNLKNTAVKNSSMLSISLRVPEQSSQPSKSKKTRKNKSQQQNIGREQQSNIPNFSQYSGSTSDTIGVKQPSVSGSAFNFTTSSNATNSCTFYNKEITTSATAAAYAFLDDFRNPNLSSYYSIALRQQQVQQQQQVQHQQIQQQVDLSSDVVQQTCNKLSNQTTRSYSGHPFLHPTQRPTPYRPSVPPYVTSHTSNLSVDPAAYQQYLHSLYALQPPTHHRPTWL